MARSTKGKAYGYARVSTDEQTLDLQLDALKKAGCDEVFIDEVSGASLARPGLKALLDSLKTGDVVVVWKLDRLGRSAAHLAGLLEGFRNRGIDFRSVTEGMDTRTPIGRAMYHVAAAFAQLERETIHERVVAGIAAAKADGRHCGRPRLMTPERVRSARRLMADGSSVAKVARILGVARSTLYAALAEDEARKAKKNGLPPPNRRRGRPPRSLAAA